MICLLPHCGYLSATSRMLEIYRALRARGAAVRVATHGGTYEPVLRAAGVPYDLLGPRMTERRCAEFVRSEIGLGNINQSMYTDDELRAYVAAEAAYFRAHRVRVAVTGFTLTTLLSTRLAGVALVTEHAGSWVPPAFERGLLPAPSQPGLRFVPRWLANAAPPRARFYCGGFNRVAAELGVPGVPSVAALVLGDLALVPEVPEVLGIPAGELAAWRPGGRSGYRPQTRLHYSGPLYARLDLPLPEAVEEFLHRPGPMVYVAVNSTPPELVRSVVAALCGLDVRILVAGTVHDLTDLTDPSRRRVLVGGVLPSHLVMPHAALAVTAGGQGSVQTAMAAGTPLLGLPLQPEQDLNVSLLERRGAARWLAPRHATGRRLTRLAAEMLAERGYADAAARIAELYRSVDGPANAAEAVLSLAGGATSPPVDAVVPRC